MREVVGIPLREIYPRVNKGRQRKLLDANQAVGEVIVLLWGMC